MDARTNKELELTEAEVVFLEAHNVHCPENAWMIIQRAIAAKRHDEYARRKGKAEEATQLTPELSLLAGICQKVTINPESRERMKKLYRSAFNNGKFRKKDDGTYVMGNPWREDPHGV